MVRRSDIPPPSHRFAARSIGFCSPSPQACRCAPALRPGVFKCSGIRVQVVRNRCSSAPERPFTSFRNRRSSAFGNGVQVGPEYAATRRLQLTLDNAGASGHSWPSGAASDRRAWIELTAYQGGQVIYASGNTEAVGAFPSALPLEENSPDPDLWLIRDCIFDAAGTPLVLFWQTTKLAKSNQLPGSVIQHEMVPTTSRAHFTREFPSTGTLALLPDHVTVKLHLQAIGDDVLESLVASGDLAPSVPSQIARYTLGGGAALDWTPTAANVFQATDATTGAVMTCIANGAYDGSITPAVSHAACIGLAEGQ